MYNLIIMTEAFPPQQEGTGAEKSESKFKRKTLPSSVPQRTSESSFYIDRERFANVKVAEREVIEQARKDIGEGQFWKAEAVRALEILPTKEFVLARIEADRALERYYGELGVDRIRRIDEIIYIPDDLTADQIPQEIPESTRQKILDRRTQAISYESFIVCKIPARMPNDSINRELVMVNTAKLLAHEGYHSVTPRKVELRKVRRKGEDRASWETRWGRAGLEYPGLKGKWSALEEGLAVLFEARVRDSLLKNSSVIGPAYRKDIEEVAEAENVPRECITVKWVDAENRRTVSVHYPESVRLVKFLREELEKQGYDFLVLAEEARTHQKTISLAKAVEGVFGKGSYRKVALATEDTAKEALTYLNGLLSASSSFST